MRAGTTVDAMAVVAAWCLGAGIAQCGPASGGAGMDRPLAALRAAAEGGEAVACVRLGEALVRGDGTAKDPAQARQWFAKAIAGFRRLAWLGHPRARYALSPFFDGPRLAASDPQADAYWLMAEAFVNGLEKSPEPQEASRWFAKAVARYEPRAREGSPLACCHMGEAAMYGKGTAKDASASRRWYARAIEGYRKAAGKGDSSALYMLGDLYIRGLGADKDLKQGADWWRKAAAGGNVQAMERLGFVFDIDTIGDSGGALNTKDKDNMKKVIKQHIHWLRMAAEKGSPLGCGHMAEAYIGGEGGVVAKDVPLAIQWLEKATAGPTEYAVTINESRVYLARIYRAGKIVDKNEKRAGELFAQALPHFRQRADWGDSWGMFNLGELYENGEGVPADHAQALVWYRKAAQAGDRSARDLLKRMEVEATKRRALTEIKSAKDAETLQPAAGD